MANKTLPINYLFPNLVTVLSLCFGMSSIKYALDGRWELSVGLLVTSAFLDGMDGRLARMLNASSRFGAELDSLADFINFGVAPALLLYFWSLSLLPIKGVGWAIALTYTICCAFRLARFNAGFADENIKNQDKNFFLGIPAPCGAGLTLIPIMLSFKYEFMFFKHNPEILAIYLLIIAFIMASQIPTISTKDLHIKSNMIFPTLFLFTIFIVSLIIEPWFILPLTGLVYIITIPFSIFFYCRNEQNSRN